MRARSENSRFLHPLETLPSTIASEDDLRRTEHFRVSAHPANDGHWGATCRGRLGWRRSCLRSAGTNNIGDRWETLIPPQDGVCGLWGRGKVNMGDDALELGEGNGNVRKIYFWETHSRREPSNRCQRTMQLYLGELVETTKERRQVLRPRLSRESGISCENRDLSPA